MKKVKNQIGNLKLTRKQLEELLEDVIQNRMKIQGERDELLFFCKDLYQRLKATTENAGSSSYGDTFYVMYDRENSIGDKLEQLIKGKQVL